jgi:hypothetical protein
MGCRGVAAGLRDWLRDFWDESYEHLADLPHEPNAKEHTAVRNVGAVACAAVAP